MRFKAAHTCPLLCLIVYGLLLLCRTPAFAAATADMQYLTSIILQVLIFVIPATVYCRLRGTGYATKLNFRPVGPTAIGVTLLTLLTMIAGSLLIRMGQLTLALGDTSISFTGFTGVTVDSVSDGIYLSLSLAVVPAICEEFLFRSLLFTEYTGEGYGWLCVGGLTSLLFAMMHFDAVQFPIYLWTGILLVMLTYVTGSVFPAMLCHFAYNMYGLFGESYLLRFLEKPQSTVFLFFCIAAIFLVLLIILLGEVERVFTVYGTYDKETPDYVLYRAKTYPKQSDRTLHALRAVTSPLLLCCILVFVMMAIAAK